MPGTALGAVARTPSSHLSPGLQPHSQYVTPRWHTPPDDHSLLQPVAGAYLHRTPERHACSCPTCCTSTPLPSATPRSPARSPSRSWRSGTAPWCTATSPPPRCRTSTVRASPPEIGRAHV